MRLCCISIIVLMAVSCSPTKRLQNSLSEYELPIGYIHNSKEINCYKFGTLYINLKNNPLDSLTTVSLIHKHSRYLVFYVSKDIKMNVKLGQSSLEKPYNDFFLSSLKDESKRTGCFAISNRLAGDSIYTLEITIDSCKTTADYQYQMSSSFGFLKDNTNCYPSETNMQVSTKLKRGGALIAEKSYTIKRKQPYLVLQNVKVDNLHADLMSNMVESLSLSTKECVEKIVNDLNISIITTK